MQTLTIDIINDKAIKLLQNLESQHLIKLHKKSNAIEKEKSDCKT
jgi:hypothetical protein